MKRIVQWGAVVVLATIFLTACSPKTTEEQVDPDEVIEMEESAEAIDQEVEAMESELNDLEKDLDALLEGLEE